jgi:hypothetical protein
VVIGGGEANRFVETAERRFALRMSASTGGALGDDSQLFKGHGSIQTWLGEARRRPPSRFRNPCSKATEDGWDQHASLEEKLRILGENGNLNNAGGVEHKLARRA